MISDYFDFIKKVASQHPDVVKFRLIREVIGVNKGFIRFALDLRDSTELHIFEMEERKCINVILNPPMCDNVYLMGK